MELNSLIFPIPKQRFNFKQLKNETIWIPSFKNKSLIKFENEENEENEDNF